MHIPNHLVLIEMVLFGTTDLDRLVVSLPIYILILTNQGKLT